MDIIPAQDSQVMFGIKPTHSKYLRADGEGVKRQHLSQKRDVKPTTKKNQVAREGLSSSSTIALEDSEPGSEEDVAAMIEQAL